MSYSNLNEMGAKETGAVKLHRLPLGGAVKTDGSSTSRVADPQRERFEKRWNLFLRDTAKLQDFNIVRVIGVGAFGHVLYVIHRQTKRDYALKVMRKEKIVRMSQVERVFFEKRILQSMAHPFLVDLRFVFKTNSYLCIVMPFIRGGEIYSYIKSKKYFSEYQARFYAAQLVLALQYMHKMSIIYRDLKPENVLLDCDGYIKIIDYGFAKRTEAKTKSFVGTPEYMSPEMLIPESRKQGYLYSVDWWSFGVLVYEMAAGKPPFVGSSLLQVFDRIVKCEYSIPNHFTTTLEDLLSRIFIVDADKRIASTAKDAEEMMAHPWFKSIQWDQIANKKMAPEFVPDCKQADPTSNFEHFTMLEFTDTPEPEYNEEFKSF